MKPADICRLNGWGPGTRLAGPLRVNGGGRVRLSIEITAVGREWVLAVPTYPETATPGMEGPWSLEGFQLAPD